mgnify:CR=1 FL=1
MRFFDQLQQAPAVHRQSPYASSVFVAVEQGANSIDSYWHFL